jgi:uracil-DNA glycosylase family 4
VGLPTRRLTTSLEPHRDRDVVVYVGRNPGFHEDQEGRCFVGRSGQLLERAFVGGTSIHRRATVWFTNMARCYTVNDVPPKAKHYKACRGYLEHDLAALAGASSPDAKFVVVLLGGDAVSHFHRNSLGVRGINLTKAFAQQGREYQVEWCPRPFTVFSTFHPAFVLRDPNQINAVSAHCQLILDYLRGTMAQPSEPTIVEPRYPDGD